MYTNRIYAEKESDASVKVSRIRFWGNREENNTVYEIVIDVDPTEFMIGFKAWNNGTLIQNALPQLNADEREFLISGVTPEEWDEIFNDNNDCELNNPEVA